MTTTYEWDPAKAERNARIQGVTFEQATVALEDPLAVYLLDRVVEDELRHHIRGSAGGLLLLMVAHTVRGNDEQTRVRIISARPAERWERQAYGAGAGG